MTAIVTPWIRRYAAVAAAAAVLAVLAGCSIGTGSADTVAAVPASSARSVPPSIAPGVPVVLRFGDHAVAATLADTPASREFAARLPMTLELRDAWGQAKAGRLPHPVRADGAVLTLKPHPGGIYYWPDSAALTVYYDDLGQSVPPPGVLLLGVVDTGIDEIADAGRRVTVRIDRAAGIRS